MIPAMRITGGELGGRLVKVPRTAMRPTQDRVRGSLFSILGERVPGCRFLDLYAGTGAVGIEAWSRGAAQVCWVEAHPAILQCLEENVRALCGEGVGRVIRGEVEGVLRRGPQARLGGSGDVPFDVIFADPPYDKRRRGEGSSVNWGDFLAVIETGGWLSPDGWLVIEQGDDEPLVERAGWVLIRDRRYGGTRLRVLARAAESADKEI